MALYQGLNRPRQDEEPAWRVKRHGGGEPQASFLDRMFGKGSREALKLRKPSAPTVQAPMATRRFQTVGGAADTAPKRGRKGLIRSALLLACAGWGLAAIQPRERLAPALSELSQLLRLPSANTLGSSRPVGASELGVLPQPSPTPEPDWQEFSGSAVALWQDAAGAWWQVSREGGLRSTPSQHEKGNLGLPVIVGATLRTRPAKVGLQRMLLLDTVTSAKALPLLGELRSEVRAVSLRAGEGLVIYTHDGTRAELGADDLARRQRRLSRVLADLGAKRKRASLVDLRFEDTAVVRLAAR